MKRLCLFLAVLMLVTFVGGAVAPAVIAQPQQGDLELLGAMDFQRFAGYFNPGVPNTTFTNEIIAERPDGSKQAVVQVSFKFAEEAFFARIDYLSPEELSGDVFLITNEEIFFWNPDLITPLKVNGRFEVFGDATVVEVIGIFFQGQYAITNRSETTLTDGAPALRFELEGLRESVAFPKAVAIAEAESLRVITLQLFDESGDLLHENTFESYAETPDGRPYFDRQLLDNRIVPVNQTLLIITNIENTVLPDALFDVNELGQ